MTTATDLRATRALTVRQPFADLIVSGMKDVENRSWPVPSTLPQWTQCSGCAMRWAPGDGPPFSYEHWHGNRRGWMERTADGPFPFRLAIHAGKRWDREHGWDTLLQMSQEAHDVAVRNGAGPLYSPIKLMCQMQERAGALLGFVTVTGCHHADDCHRWGPYVSVPGPSIGGRHCSRWAEADRWHWTLTNPIPLDVPVPMKGRQGLWRLPETL